jgi:hypothetical protein
MSDHTPEQIAARLSPAQKRAIMWLPADGSAAGSLWRGAALAGVAAFKDPQILVTWPNVAPKRYAPALTPLGLAVRAVLAKEGGKDE